MENLKIKVNSEAESKEAQGYFEGLGAVCCSGLERNKNVNFLFMESGFLTACKLQENFDKSKCKEITLPDLRDLVVLNCNDVADATHEDCGNKYYIATSGYLYGFVIDKWLLCAAEKSNTFKPIEKTMKEYLRKNSNGTYSYIGTVRPEHVSDFMIEIPEGCNIITCENRKGNLIYFHWKSLDSDEFFLKDEKIWSNNFDETLFDFIEKNEGDVVIIWSRYTHPEELPFIDDEPLQSLNDQYAEIEKVRQSHRTASEIADSALKHIRERAETYDQPTGERSAAKTAKAFNAITGKDITESEVWLLLQLLKDVRQWSREDYHQDSAEDCIAYASLKAESLESGE